MSDIVERLRVMWPLLPDANDPRPAQRELGRQAADMIERMRAERAEDAAEIARLRAEVDSLRLTLGGRTFCADVPEPVGCPTPGACSTVAEIRRLRAALRIIRDEEPERGAWSVGVAASALGGTP